MLIPKILAIIGLAAIILGVAFTTIPATMEVWIPKSWTLVRKVAAVYPGLDYYPLDLAPYIPQESRNLVVSGTVRELKGRTFDLYIFNRLNYEGWKAGATYEAYLQAKNVSSRSFSLPIMREDVSEGLHLVVLNIHAKEPAQESWIDEVFTLHEWMDYYYVPYFYPYVDMKKLPILVDGAAKELAGRKFSLIILEDKNYDLWKIGQPYDAFYEARNVTACSFSFPLTPEQVTRSIYPIIERVEPGAKLNVKLNANISYIKPIDLYVQYDVTVTWEEKSYAHVQGGFLLGRRLLFFGVILMIAAALMKYVFRP